MNKRQVLKAIPDRKSRYGCGDGGQCYFSCAREGEWG